MEKSETVDGVSHERRFKGDGGRLRSPERVARLEVPRVVELSLAGLKASSLLDVGTGTGIFAEAFANRCLVVTGIDANADLLAQARTFVPGAEFREAVAEAIPFSDGSFDLVFLGLVLHETDDALAALREARRVGRQRVVVLEWPYRDQSFGPPLTDQLPPALVADLAAKVGFTAVEAHELEYTTLYLATP